jgi:seryl-tRNA synthetase
MIDIRQLRENPDRFRQGARDKNAEVDLDRLLALDAERRDILQRLEARRAEQNRLSKEIGPQIGKLKGQLKSAEGAARAAAEAQLAELESKPVALKSEVAALEEQLRAVDPHWNDLLMRVPQPPAHDVPRGPDSSANVEIRRWHPAGFDPAKGFEANKGFRPRTHLELVRELGLADFERGVKMSGTRHYILTGMGMRLHQAVLRYAFDHMVEKHGFTAIGVPVIVKEECMQGTGFFPFGREQAYHIEESARGSGHDLFLTGTGEVGLMGIHADEILPESALPLTYTTVSRAWHKRMLGFVEEILQSLGLPYRLLQCCTGDLGMKNEDMIDVECWMPGRGELGKDGAPTGEYGETHSASRLGDFQCRRLNLRYKDADGKVHFAWALNNTVIASPRVLIPLLEIHQNADGTVTVPEPLRPHLGGRTRIEPPVKRA